MAVVIGNSYTTVLPKDYSGNVDQRYARQKGTNCLSSAVINAIPERSQTLDSHTWRYYTSEQNILLGDCLFKKSSCNVIELISTSWLTPSVRRFLQSVKLIELLENALLIEREFVFVMNVSTHVWELKAFENGGV